ncbi:MAG: hypothetical protein JXN61_08245, partial [Sedimentisphaerales bacterium]|nr:hypothetical protein [Sedimentisphaerales bacterium]
KTALFDMSEGGAYVHNLFAGRVVHRPELGRETPYHKAHSVEVAGLSKIKGGDDRFYNNIIVNYDGLATYDNAAQAMGMAGNVFVKGAKASKHDKEPVVRAEFDPGIQLVEEKDGVYLRVTLEKAWTEDETRGIVTSEMLGRAVVAELPYRQPDGSLYRIEADYFGSKRDVKNPFPGPFEVTEGGRLVLKIWPVN